MADIQMYMKNTKQILNIKLHAPTSSTQKLKLMGERWAIHLYSNTSIHAQWLSCIFL